MFCSSPRLLAITTALVATIVGLAVARAQAPDIAASDIAGRTAVTRR